MDSREPMLDIFIFETFEMLEKLQDVIIDSEKFNVLETDAIDEIFRIMHTIKGSSGMMMFDNISSLSHTIEDIFYFIRESKPKVIDYSSLTDLVLEGSDLIKLETEKINDDKDADGDFSLFVNKAKEFLESLKSCNQLSENLNDEGSLQELENMHKYYLSNDKHSAKLNYFSAVLFFDEECDMENIRCFTVVHQLKEIAEVEYFYPEDIIENSDSCEIIKQEGFKIFFKINQNFKEVKEFLLETMFLNSVDITEFNNENEFSRSFKKKNEEELVEECIIKEINEINEINENKKTENKKRDAKSTNKQSLISVDVNKLDKLMDLVGELVISEAMVTKNPEIINLKVDSFNKAARQHRKRISDLQDVVMSIRMVPLAPTLNKMNRIIRDMSKKLGKEAELEIIGQDTEVDKNIIEHISDPLMHIIRNSMDHGIESKEERLANGKSIKGRITIEAKNTGGEVWIIISDDGRGLDKEKILKKAKMNGLVKNKDSELTDKEIYSMIFLAGFSTNENVTEFSGRGVGMDVVVKEIEKIRGVVTVDSIPGKGSIFTIKIPLTLAIINGMNIKVGNTIFTIPVTAIRQSFIIKKEDIIKGLENNEMILIRGESYSILRIHEIFNINTKVTNIEDGIVIMLEDQDKVKCIFADTLIGEQQVVIKALPEYIKKVKGVSGCSLLGDATISLILNVSEILDL